MARYSVGIKILALIKILFIGYFFMRNFLVDNLF